MAAEGGEENNQFEEVKISVGKYKINYLKVGHGELKVFCMPGAMGSVWTDFKPQVEGFDREKFTLIVWDAPGYGKSRPPEREFASDYYAQDVDIAFEFMKALNIRKFSILGWCYGGVSAIIFAAKYPQVVHKLVVWGARTTIEEQILNEYNLMKDVNLWSERNRIGKIEVYGEEGLIKLWSQVVDAMTAYYHTNNGIIISNDVLEKVTCPTFILHGEKDPILHKAGALILHDKIQGSRWHLYSEGKHNIHLRFAEDFNSRVQDFLLED